MFYNSTTWVTSPFPVDEGQDIFAIGDIHGCADEIDALINTIETHFVSNKENTLIIYLGDYIDRGPNSKGVLNFLTNQSNSQIQSIFLAGNHDQYIIELIKPDLDPDLDRYFINLWYENGGIATMKNLEITGYGRLMDANNIEELRTRTIYALGPKNVDFLLSLKYSYKNGNFLYVHAGIDPSRSIADQDMTDLLMIREPFLSTAPWNHQFCVVHGHSISPPHVHAHRINTDAGVVLNGTLCAAQISKRGIRFIGVTKEKDFPWKKRFNNESIGLTWNIPQELC